jgi:hypothetical protein
LLVPKAENKEDLERAIKLNQELLKRVPLFSQSALLKNKIEENRKASSNKSFISGNVGKVSVETDRRTLAIGVLVINQTRKEAIDSRDLFIKTFKDNFSEFFNFSSVTEIKTLSAEDTAFTCRERIWYYPLLGALVGFLTAFLAFSFPKKPSQKKPSIKVKLKDSWQKAPSLPLEDHNIFKKTEKKSPNKLLEKEEDPILKKDFPEEEFQEDETKIKERLNRLINGEF